MSNSERIHRGTQAVVRHAVARGFLSPAQLREALLIREELTQRGQAVELLPLLRARYLPAASLEELTRVYQGAVSQSGSGPAARGTTREFPAEAPALDAELLRKSSELIRRSPEQDPEPVRAFLRESGTGELADVSQGFASTLSHSPRELASATRAPLGERLGSYRLIKELARGGMGVVYRAHSERLDRPVALKVMKNADAADEEEVARFLTEARAAARLRHPNIVGVHEAGEEGGEYFIAMDLIEGESLKAWVRHQLPPIQDAVRIGLKICEALGYAHERGILHRDLKPSNVLLDGDGEPWLTDFGLAKDVTAERGLTVTGQVLGTPAYMSPEQALGESNQVDVRSDVYSLGATLYELVTGRAPFRGSTALSIMDQVVRDEPPLPSSLRSEIDTDLEAICLKCLEKHPLDRYASTSELSADLRAYLAGESIQARLPTLADRVLRWSRRNRALVALSVAVGVAFVGVAAGAYSWGAGARDKAPDRSWADREAQLAALLAQIERGELRQDVELDAAVRELIRTDAGADPVSFLCGRLDALTADALAVARATYLEAEEPTDLERDAGLRRLEGLRQAFDAWAAQPPERSLGERQRNILKAARARIEQRDRSSRPSTVEAPVAPVERQIASAQAVALGRRLAAAEVVCRALGQLGDRQAVAALGGYLHAEFDPNRAVAPALALCQLGGEEAYRYVARGLQRFGSGSTFGGPVTRAFGRIQDDRPEADSAVDLLGRARARFAVRDWSGAEEDASAILEQTPNNAHALVMRARVRLKRNEIEAAQRDVEAAVRVGGEPLAWLVQGEIYSQRNQFAEAEKAFTELTRQAPEEIRGWTRRAGIRVLRRDLDGALKDSEHAIRLAPNDAHGYYARGEARHQRGDHEGAFRDYDRAVELDPGDFMALSYRGVLHHRLGRADDALADVSRALDLAPEDDDRRAQPLSTRGAILMERGELARAVKDLERAAEIDPKLAAPLNYLGVARARLGDSKGALEALDRSIAIEPSTAMTYANRAAIRQKMGDRRAALGDLERAVQLEPENAFVRAKRGEIHGELGNLRTGLEDLQAATRLAPREGVYWTYLGDLHARRKDFNAALAAFRRATEVQPRLGVGWIKASQVSRLAGDGAAALGLLAAGIEANPQDGELWRERAKVQVRAGALEDAESDFSRCLQLNPRDRLAWAGRGTVRLALRRTAKGEADLERAVSDAPDLAKAWLERAKTRGALGDRVGALSDLERAEALAGGSELVLQVWYERAQVLLESGDVKGALRELERYLERRPEDARAVRALRLLKERLKD